MRSSTGKNLMRHGLIALALTITTGVVPLSLGCRSSSSSGAPGATERHDAPPAHTNGATGASSAPGTSGAAAASGGPCTAGTAACLQRITIGSQTFPFYGSWALAAHSASVRHIRIVVHGANRDAWGEFAAVATAALAQGHGQDTVVLAPYFQTDPSRPCVGETDAPAATDLVWKCSPSTEWQAGAPAQNAPGGMSAFAVMDQLLQQAIAAFPGAKDAAILGFSAGGQFTQRFAALRDSGGDKVPVRYVIGNPGSLMYLDPRRLRARATCDDTCSNLAVDSFEVPRKSACATTYDNYKYGTGQLASSVVAGYTGARHDFATAFAAREVDYLIASKDDSPASGNAFSVLDVSCEADLQGPIIAATDRKGQPVPHSFRADRLRTFHQAMVKLHGAAHAAHEIADCGHDSRCVYASPVAQAVLFR
jgi:hypothetical protein